MFCYSLYTVHWRHLQFAYRCNSAVSQRLTEHNELNPRCGYHTAPRPVTVRTAVMSLAAAWRHIHKTAIAQQNYVHIWYTKFTQILAVKYKLTSERH
jgi:hypothetical protein